jgi:hypothetical protein
VWGGRYSQSDPLTWFWSVFPGPYRYGSSNPLGFVDRVGFFAIDSSCSAAPFGSQFSSDVAAMCKGKANGVRSLIGLEGQRNGAFLSAGGAAKEGVDGAQQRRLALRAQFVDFSRRRRILRLGFEPLRLGFFIPSSSSAVISSASAMRTTISSVTRRRFAFVVGDGDLDGPDSSAQLLLGVAPLLTAAYDAARRGSPFRSRRRTAVRRWRRAWSCNRRVSPSTDL